MAVSKTSIHKKFLSQRCALNVLPLAHSSVIQDNALITFGSVVSVRSKVQHITVNHTLHISIHMMPLLVDSGMPGDNQQSSTPTGNQCLVDSCVQIRPN